MPNNYSLEIKSTFFTEISNLTAQASNKSFGVDDNAATQVEKEQYFRVTSSFTATSNQKAFAICKGRVFIQPQVDAQGAATNYVNLILQPYVQPSNRLKVKYFVYRGLKKSGFVQTKDINGVDTDVLPDYSSTSGVNSRLIEKVWDNHIAYYQIANPASEDILARLIGLNPSQQLDTDLIDDYLFNISTDDLKNETSESTQFELQMVEEGDWIGDFESGVEFGLDIVLDNGDTFIEGTGFNFDLAYAKAQSWTFDTSTITAPTQDEKDVKIKRYREAILNFIDPAAFWGEHYNINSSIDTYNNTLVKSTKLFDPVTDPNNPVTTIYSDVVNLFYTKNNIYIYVQCERGRSYNFYGNYIDGDTSTNNDIYFGPQSNLTNQRYAKYQWPLIATDTTPISANGRNNFYFQFITDNNFNMLLYSQNGKIESSSNGNFILYEDLHISEDSHYTDEVQISFPAEPQGNNVSSIFRFIYRGKVYSAGVAVPQGNENVYLIKDIDELFGINIADTVIKKGNNNYVYSKTNGKVEASSLLMVSDNNQTFAALNSRMVYDIINDIENQGQTQQRVLFETETIDIAKRNSLTGDIISSYKDPRADFAREFDPKANNHYAIETDAEIELAKLLIYPTSFFALRFVPDGVLALTKLIIGVSQSEYDSLVSLISTNNLINCSIFFDTASKQEYTSLRFYSDSDVTGKVNTESEWLAYSTINIGLLGENDEREIKIYFPQSNIEVLTLDNYIYTTKDYIKNIPTVTNKVPSSDRGSEDAGTSKE